MFSIAAINESDTGGQWEPLAPTKEAQESALSQKYHEGLLKLQEKDYAKAGELLEDVLKDPLISKIQVDNFGSDQHLLQLRFLTLKNLASVFLQQGSEFYDNALHCYLQAVELDANDSVVWNHLGTLSCSMSLLSTSRWAFEQGLLCSPNNWNCMEKLLEVLIAIRDEVACLSVANIILRSWPSHPRALHVNKTIEHAEPVPFAPRGIDILEPKHAKLNFSDKRKSADDAMHQETARNKRGTPTAIASSQVQPAPHSTVSSQVGSKEKSAHIESREAHEANPLDPAMVIVSPHQEAGGASASQIATDAQKVTTAASQLTCISASRAMENPQEGGTGNDGTT